MDLALYYLLCYVLHCSCFVFMVVVGQWLALLPHSEKAVLEPFCVQANQQL